MGVSGHGSPFTGIDQLGSLDGGQPVVLGSENGFDHPRLTTFIVTYATFHHLNVILTDILGKYNPWRLCIHDVTKL
jgi:hypothetical protein